MTSISDIRRARLAELVDRDTLTVVAERFKKPPRQINDMLAKRKSFGEKIARAMEATYAEHTAELAPGWLDVDTAIIAKQPPAKPKIKKDNAAPMTIDQMRKQFAARLALEHERTIKHHIETLDYEVWEIKEPMKATGHSRSATARYWKKMSAAEIVQFPVCKTSWTCDEITAQLLQQHDIEDGWYSRNESSIQHRLALLERTGNLLYALAFKVPDRSTARLTLVSKNPHTHTHTHTQQEACRDAELSV